MAKETKPNSTISSTSSGRIRGHVPKIGERPIPPVARCRLVEERAIRGAPRVQLPCWRENADRDVTSDTSSAAERAQQESARIAVRYARAKLRERNETADPFEVKGVRRDSGG